MDAQRLPTAMYVALAMLATLVQTTRAQQCIATAATYSRLMTAVRDQGPTCNSCWAFATADTFEDTIVGWDDTKHAWRIKNSQNTTWGDQGYLWLDYTSNKIGSGATWVEAKVPLRPNPPSALRVE